MQNITYCIYHGNQQHNIKINNTLYQERINPQEARPSAARYALDCTMYHQEHTLTTDIGWNWKPSDTFTSSPGSRWPEDEAVNAIAVQKRVYYTTVRIMVLLL